MLNIFKKRTRLMAIVDLSERSTNDDSLSYLFDAVTVDYPNEITLHRNTPYLAHPDSVLLDNGRILVAYVKGHGRGETLLKESTDGGRTWSDRIPGLPESFLHTDETPTIYKLDFCDGMQKLILISGRPGWGYPGDGFDVSLSTSVDAKGRCDGKVWSPHENFFGSHAVREEYLEPCGKWAAIVAMASLTRIKENGEYIDKWMGLFHLQRPFRIFKTYLTFDGGVMNWSYPTKLFPKEYDTMEQKLHFCEPELVRSPDGKELALLIRTNAHVGPSYVSFSVDEGNTWTTPQPLSYELTGDRHKAEYDPKSGKLVVTFRSVDYYVKRNGKNGKRFSYGWLAWVGDYDELHKGENGRGDYCIKLAHTYKKGQNFPQTEANDDTGYAGLTVDRDGNFVAMSYGKFSKNDETTYILSKRFSIESVNRLRKTSVKD